ncbi:hypothetical protein D3C76_622190 [compost metagenome]
MVLKRTGPDNSMEGCVIHKWECTSGCGEVFCTTKKWKVKKPICPICETRSTVIYKGEVKVLDKRGSLLFDPEYKGDGE